MIKLRQLEDKYQKTNIYNINTLFWKVVFSVLLLFAPSNHQYHAYRSKIHIKITLKKYNIFNFHLNGYFYSKNEWTNTVCWCACPPRTVGVRVNEVVTWCSNTAISPDNTEEPRNECHYMYTAAWLKQNHPRVRLRQQLYNTA